MRTIKFRGKRVDTKEWVYGYFGILSDHQPINNKVRHYILIEYYGDWGFRDFEAVEVIPETVGQFTGLTDKNGKEIYEGDIVNVTLKDCYSELFTVVFVDSQARFSFLDKDGIQWIVSSQNDMKVIGNIHDNPEMLEAK